MKKNWKVKSITREQRKLQLKQLRSIIGQGALRSLQTTGTLKIWKRSSPHNWWVESKRGNMLWHSKTTYEEGKRIYPDLSMFYTTTLNIGNYLPEYWKLKDEYKSV